MDRADFKKTLAARVAGTHIEQKHADFLLDVFDSAARHGVGLYDHLTWDSSEWRLVDADSGLNEIGDLAYLTVDKT